MNAFDLSKEKDNCRKEFEEWFCGNKAKSDKWTTMYSSLVTQDTWEAFFMGWHAAIRNVAGENQQ